MLLVARLRKLQKTIIFLCKNVTCLSCPYFSKFPCFILKVFLKYWQSDHLNAILDNLMGRVVQVQAKIRSYLERRRFLYRAQMSKQDADEVMMLAEYINHQGDQVFQSMMSQNDHDVTRATRSRHHREMVRI